MCLETGDGDASVLFTFEQSLNLHTRRRRMRCTVKPTEQQ